MAVLKCCRLEEVRWVRISAEEVLKCCRLEEVRWVGISAEERLVFVQI